MVGWGLGFEVTFIGAGLWTSKSGRCYIFFGLQANFFEVLVKKMNAKPKVISKKTPNFFCSITKRKKLRIFFFENC